MLIAWINKKKTQNELKTKKMTYKINDLKNLKKQKTKNKSFIIIIIIQFVST